MFPQRENSDPGITKLELYNYKKMFGLQRISSNNFIFIYKKRPANSVCNLQIIHFRNHRAL